MRQAWFERHSDREFAAPLTAISGYAFSDLHSDQ